MKRFFTEVLFGFLSVALTLLALPAQPGLAQKKPQPKAPAAQPPAASQWLSINVVRVKPDMLTEYQEFVKKQYIPTLQKGGVKERNAYTTAVFGEAFEYVFVAPIESFAQYDGQSPVVKALGEEGARDFGEKARRLIVSTRTFAIQTRPDLSYMGKMTGQPKYAVINSVHIAPGRNAEYESILKNDVVPAMKKAEVVGYLVSQTAFGGDLNEYTSLTLYDNFADIGKGSPLVLVLGQEGFNRLRQKTAGIIVHHERSVARYVPELSFSAPARAATN